MGDTPAVQEIGCHFSGNDPNVLKLPDFFKNDVKPKVKGTTLLMSKLCSLISKKNNGN